MVTSLENAVPNGHSLRTPAPKVHRQIRDAPPTEERKSTDKKRKRQVESLDLSALHPVDAEMPDAEPRTVSGKTVLHSGLTGGLNRLLSKSAYREPDPSPIVSTQRKVSDRSHTSDKGRGRDEAGALVKVRKIRRSSDESRPRKHHRSHRHRSDEHPDRERHTKPIEYADRHEMEGDSGHRSGQMVIYRSRAELFLSFVTKGPESTGGCSVNKALKRYHREREALGLGSSKADEEKELWRGLRLRRNERGEIVVIT